MTETSGGAGGCGHFDGGRWALLNNYSEKKSGRGLAWVGKCDGRLFLPVSANGLKTGPPSYEGGGQEARSTFAGSSSRVAETYSAFADRRRQR